MFKSYQGEFHAIIKNGGRVCLREWERKRGRGQSGCIVKEKNIKIK